ncbi:MAG: endonuclease III [Bacteroidota bacterium]
MLFLKRNAPFVFIEVEKNRMKKQKSNAKKIMDILKNEYPDVKPALEYSTPFQLLVATILSAQCTDERVNIVTNELFKKLRNPSDFVSVGSSELEKYIFSTGFYMQKAKNIKLSSALLIEKYGGSVPKEFEELVKLPGVGRKTASVIAGNAFGIPAIAVDTHVIRLSNLLGFVQTKNAEKIEFALRKLLPQNYWVASSHLLATHGRRVCIARRPKCLECAILDYCPSFKNY